MKTERSWTAPFGHPVRRFGLLALLALGACGGGAPDGGQGGDVAPVVIGALTGNPGAGERIFRQCKACHTIGAAAPDTDGPNLYDVVGGPVAQRRPRFAYTAALQQFGGRWDPARLDAWLRDPRALVPGTTMRFGGLSDAQQRADVIAYLASYHSPAQR